MPSVDLPPAFFSKKNCRVSGKWEVGSGICRFNVGDVTHPFLVGPGGRGCLGEIIGRNGRIVVAVGGDDSKAAFLAAPQSEPAHHASDPVALNRRLY